jgi:hypothetical protein
MGQPGYHLIKGRNNRGFTWVKLSVVTAIIGHRPGMLGPDPGQADQVANRDRMKPLGFAFLFGLPDHDDTPPARAAVGKMVSPTEVWA